MTSEIIVKAVDVSKRFGDFLALDKVNVEVKRGEVSCIIGPSGSGKSTFLRCINLLERMDGGAIWVSDELVGYRRDSNKLHEISDSEIARQRRRIGMVFQRFNLFPHMTALQNIMEGPVRSWARRSRRPANMPKHCSIASVSATRRTIIHPSFPAASSSVWRSPAPWGCGRN
jgi:polar amino acid transport system ATP-binding protein